LVAGLLEGEGCFFPMEYRTEKYGPYVYARVAVLMTDLDILQRLQQVTGVGQDQRADHPEEPQAQADLALGREQK
jgi:hypothetical protein